MINIQIVFLVWLVLNRDHLYPFLFSVFLNDLEDYCKHLAGCPLEIVKEKFRVNLHIFIEAFVLL